MTKVVIIVFKQRQNLKPLKTSHTALLHWLMAIILIPGAMGMLALILLELGMPDISVSADSTAALLYLATSIAVLTIISTLISARFIRANYIINEPKKVVWLSVLFTFISNIPAFAIILLLSFVSNGLGGGDTYQLLKGVAFLTWPVWSTIVPFLLISLKTIKHNADTGTPGLAEPVEIAPPPNSLA